MLWNCPGGQSKSLGKRNIEPPLVSDNAVIHAFIQQVFPSPTLCQAPCQPLDETDRSLLDFINVLVLIKQWYITSKKGNTQNCYQLLAFQCEGRFGEKLLTGGLGQVGEFRLPGAWGQHRREQKSQWVKQSYMLMGDPLCSRRWRVREEKSQCWPEEPEDRMRACLLRDYSAALCLKMHMD